MIFFSVVQIFNCNENYLKGRISNKRRHYIIKKITLQQKIPREVDNLIATHEYINFENYCQSTTIDLEMY